MTDFAELPIRAATPADVEQFQALLSAAFHEHPDPDRAEIERDITQPERSLVTTDGDQIVGHVSSFGRDMTVPGAVLPAAHVTQVGVASTHRRRGLLTRMMHRQLREIHEAGREPFATLWASEGRIYPRFGYGLASQHLSLEIESREATLRRDWQRPGLDAGRLRAGDPATMRKDLETVYERLRPTAPGWSSRNEAWWRYVLADTDKSRHDYTRRRAVVVDGPDGPTGYATWRSKLGWTNKGPCAEVEVHEVLAEDPGTYTALWDFLLNLDLARTVRYQFASVDEPLLHLVDEPRRLGARLYDGLWVRLVHVATALAERRYAVPLDVVFEVEDPLLAANTGRWRLTGDQDGASCVPTTAPADLACDIRALGAAYLGGPSLLAQAAAGRVRELRPGTLMPASVAFGWRRAPGAIEIF